MEMSVKLNKWNVYFSGALNRSRFLCPIAFNILTENPPFSLTDPLSQTLRSRLWMNLPRYGGCLWFLSAVQYEYTQSSQRKENKKIKSPSSGSVARLSFIACWAVDHAQVGKSARCCHSSSGRRVLAPGSTAPKTARKSAAIVWSIMRCVSDIHWLPCGYSLCRSTRLFKEHSREKIELCCTKS